MKEKLIVGRYLPYDSFIHRLDPRAKLLGTIFFIVIIFFANNWQTYLVLSLFVLLAIYLSKLPFKQFLNGVRPMLVLFVFTAMMQILFTPGRTTYFSWGIIAISQEGILQGIYIFLRFVLIIFISLLLTLSTEALQLTDAIEYLFKPLKIFNISVHEPALMLSIAMRFVPTLFDEAETIMNAQRARGMDFSEGSILQRIRNFVPLLIPLFNSSFDRAIDLATAMEARDYRAGEYRTKYRELKWSAWDTLVIITFLILFVIILYLRS
jgi:energy-coupling factor transport system permease protein